MKSLVVDDGEGSRMIMKELLKSYGEVSTAVNGKEGVEDFSKAMDEDRPYDLICMDIVMPVMDGHDALKAIRKIEEEKGIRGLDRAKVIMTTARDTTDDYLEAFFKGLCDAYIEKPVNREKLSKELAKIGLI